MAAPEQAAARHRRRSPRQLEESEQNRSAIVRTALQVFANNGYTKTTLHAVAEQVGLTRQGILHHFGSKEGLFLAVIEESHRWASDQSRQTPDARGLAGLRAMSQFVVSRDDHVKLVHTLHAESMHKGAPEHVLSYTRTRMDSIRLLIVERLREAQDDGSLAVDVDVPTVAAMIAGAITGLQAQSLIDDSLPVDRAFEQLVDLVAFTTN